MARVGFAAHAETEPRTAGRRGKDFDEVEGEHRVLAETAARNAVAELEGDVTVEVDAFAEDPAATLIAASERLDLLVCGSRGYGPVRAVHARRGVVAVDRDRSGDLSHRGSPPCRPSLEAPGELPQGRR